jgi:serine/threonine protein phosphatase PrpC
MTPPRAPGAGGLSDPGLTRTQNEDAFLVEPPLYAVADGMGGHRAGEIASREALVALLDNAPRQVDANALARAVRAANRAVIESAGKSRTRTGMGTTLTAAMVDGTYVLVAHVGDSRAYLLHDGRLTRITEDHSVVADLVQSGTITEEEARFHPQRNVITRALGSDPDMVADVFEVQASPGGRLLLATDGLTGMIQDDYIADILAQDLGPAEAAARLVEAANRAGGYDNITVVVVDLDDTPASELAPASGSTAAGRAKAARLLWVVAALALVLVTAWGTYPFARSRGFLVDEGGFVSVYRGIPGSFAGLALSWRVEGTDIPVSRLDVPLQVRLQNGIVFSRLADALSDADALRAESQAASSTAAPSATATSPPAP